MPRYREIYIKKEAKIIVWRIEETEEQLLSLLVDYSLPESFHNYKSASHRKQFLSTQILLQAEGVLGEIYKDENGKPLLNNGFVSISHDSNYVAVMLSKKKCGIDLQSLSPKVLRISHKFYDQCDTPQEGDEVSFQTLIWSLKEALYKINGDPMVYFKEYLRINSINKNTADCSVLYPAYKSDYKMSIGKVDQLYLVYTI